MKTTTIEAHVLSEAWLQCLRHVLEDGYEYFIENGSYAGQKRKELDFAQVKITNPGNQLVTPDVPSGVPSPTTMEYRESYLPYLMTAKRAEGEQYTYGQFLEHQIGEVLQIYCEYWFNTNQAYMSVGDDHSIYLDGPPCLRGIDTRGGQI
jgi:thymidylate synthase